MGCNASLEEEARLEEEESKYAQSYLDSKGHLVSYPHPHKASVSPQGEWDFLAQSDGRVRKEREYYLVTKGWYNEWEKYASNRSAGRTAVPPPPIDNSALVDSGGRLTLHDYSEGTKSTTSTNTTDTPTKITAPTTTATTATTTNPINTAYNATPTTHTAYNGTDNTTGTKSDYCALSKEVFEFLYCLHGGGPIIYFISKTPIHLIPVHTIYYTLEHYIS
ncbi:hypothetical protein B484DRAFT_269724 [Ochromonadaceae sp. CCMP2298]|nr:hypothetical protein B484DRAFT_269724 [Ochromonadaceae sp. CCMP2298]